MKTIGRSAYGALAIGIAAGAVAVLLRPRKSHFVFRDKVALITGGSRGLGLIMARHLAAKGARVAICARDTGELRRAGDELRKIAPEVLEIRCDVRIKEDCERAVAECVGAFGRLDILINNAGVIQAGPLESQTEDDFLKAMDTHFWGAFNMMTAALPRLKRQPESRIVNIASIGGKVAVPHLAPYCASKFALVGLSSAYRSELAKDGVLVTTVCPGLMRTGSHINAEFKGQFEKEYALFSTMDALPLISMDADRAAAKILESARKGDAESIISVPAKLASTLNALFPETTQSILSMVNALLPGSNGSLETKTGLESKSKLSPSFLTANIDNEAIRNNELKPDEALA